MYDEKGNYDYEAAAAEKKFKRDSNAYTNIGASIKGAGKVIGCGLIILLVIGGFVGCIGAVLYGGGRVISQGVHDGTKK